MVAGALIAKHAIILKAGFLVDLYDRFGEAKPGAVSLPAATAQATAEAAVLNWFGPDARL